MMGKGLVVVITALVALCTVSVNGEIVTSELNNDKENGRNVTLSDQINQLLDIFNPTRLSENWLNIKDMLSQNCSQDVEHYLNGLSDHKLWAMKSNLIDLIALCDNN